MRACIGVPGQKSIFFLDDVLENHFYNLSNQIQKLFICHDIKSTSIKKNVSRNTEIFILYMYMNKLIYNIV